MDASKLDTVILIKQGSTALDAYGEATPTWTTLYEVFAQRRSRMGREYFRADQLVNHGTDYFHMRPKPGITPMMRVEDRDGNQFEVIDILISDKRGESMLLCCKRMW